MSRQSVFLVADTHWGHKRILEYCNRPFPSIEAHDEALIRNWNAKVRKDSEVFHLGDFMFGSWRQVGGLLQRLNFKTITFITGDHDRALKDWFYKNSGGESVDISTTFDSKRVFLFEEYVSTQICGYEITLCHYAMLAWKKKHYGALHAHGHAHGGLPYNPSALSMDVGIDCWGYSPISFEEYLAALKKKPVWDELEAKRRRVPNE